MKRKKLNEVKIGDTLYCIARGQNGSVDIVPLTVKNVITNGPIIDLGIYSKEAIIIKEKVPNSPEAEGQFVIDQYYRGDECFSSKYGIYTTYEEAYQDAIEELKEEHQNYQLEMKNLVKREESIMNSLVSLLKSPKTSKNIKLQPKQEWSEEDDNMLGSIIRLGTLNNDQSYWLKYLRERCCSKKHWKPSEKQIRTLEYYMHALSSNEHKEVLFGLMEQLKAL
jgi:hypothetical protein